MKLHLTFLISVALPQLIAGQDNVTTPVTLPPVPITTESNATATVPPLPITSECTNSQDCKSGSFCSTSSGRCETVTCAAWARGTPLGQQSYSENPCTAEGAAPGTAFCGWNGNCYNYDCSNWYVYGPVAYTGYDPNNPVELTCRAYVDGKEENMNSVNFGCRPWQPGNIASTALSWTHFFNQECLATPRGNDEFKCYQNLPSTSYADFQGDAARPNPPSCDREIYENEQPLYWYILQARQERKGEVINYKQGRDNTLNGDSFNQNLAEKTFYAVIISNDDAPLQTFPQPTAQPPDDSGGRLIRSRTALWMASVGFLFL